MGDFTPTATVIADSISPLGVRLTTLEVAIHRFMLPELNTHRMFSRNSASSRAVPVRTMMAKLADRPAVPVSWPTECKGMQGGPALQEHDAAEARTIWLAARDAAVVHAEQLAALGVHKSVVNRLLEPFMPHTVIVSATNWEEFWTQRRSPLAQPDIRAAAEAMWQARTQSEPAELGYGDWHRPYVQPAEAHALGEVAACQISAARCARVSYLTHDGVRDHGADLALYSRLIQAAPPHASPLEHVATPALNGTGNFTGWRQLRHLVLG